MTTSALSLSHEPPPAPPPTSDAVEVFPCSPISPDVELNANRNNCLLPIIQSSGTLSNSERKPITNDFLPSDLLLALKRQDSAGDQLYTPRKGTRLSFSPRESQANAKLRSVKAPARLWGYASRRGRLKHLTNAPPCICGAGRDISFLYDSPVEREVNTKQVS